MRWLRFESGGRARVGYQRGPDVQPVVAESLQDVIDGRGTGDAGAAIPRGDVRLLAPLRMAYKINERFGGWLASKVERIDDRLNRGRLAQPFAGHLIAIGRVAKR